MKKKCLNGCILPNNPTTLIKSNNNTYSIGRNTFICCPVCGALMPDSINKIKAFFDVYHLHPSLSTAKRLIYKSEMESAAREAFVVVENNIKELSGLDCHGMDLAAKALSFTFDQKSGVVTDPPLVSISDLSTESGRNEQTGMRFLVMGFFSGQRNIYQHNSIASGFSDSLSVVIEASFFLNKLDGHSFLKRGKWVKTEISYDDVLKNMPRQISHVYHKILTSGCRRYITEDADYGLCAGRTEGDKTLLGWLTDNKERANNGFKIVYI